MNIKEVNVTGSCNRVPVYNNLSLGGEEDGDSASLTLGKTMCLREV